MIASSVAAAPMVWPRCALMEFTGMARARGPSTRFSTSVSTRSFAGVPVPCALTRSTASGASPASARAAAHGELEPPPLRVRRRDVGAVGGARMAEEIPERPVPSARGCVGTLQDDQARALAEEEPASTPVERAHGVARQRAQDVEAALDEPAQRVRPARQDDVGLARAQEVGGQAEAGGPRRAGRRHGQRPAPGLPASAPGCASGRRTWSPSARRAAPGAASARLASSIPPSAVPTTTPIRSASGSASRSAAVSRASRAAWMRNREVRQWARAAEPPIAPAGRARNLPPELLDLSAPRDAQVSRRESPRSR